MTAFFDDLAEQVPDAMPGAMGRAVSRSTGAPYSRAQYRRDIETLVRIERQREEQDPCFFSAMGELAAGRAA